MEPFLADPQSFSTVLVSWGDPAGTWGGFRLVRNRSGFPVTHEDGSVLIAESTDTSTAGSFLDTDLTGGWYYYAIFLYNTTRSAWERAGTAQAMVPYDYDSTERLWETLPEYYKQIRDSAAGYSQALYRINPAIYLSDDDTVANEQLINFLSVFGWGVDILRSQVDSILDAYDTKSVHVSRLGLLADQFGGHVESAVPAETNRNLIRNLGLLYRKRGTLEGLEDTLRLATGWDVDVSIGPNMMLNRDQAEFTHPQVPVWDATVRYNTNAVVQANGGVYYRALGPSLNQAPPAGTSNSYWSIAPFAEALLDRTAITPSTNDISTWRVYSSSLTSPHIGKTYVGMGVSDPAVGGAETNALAVVYDSSVMSGTAVTAVSVPVGDTTADQQRRAIKYGVPIPRVSVWSGSKTYSRGDLVNYLGVVYESMQSDNAVVPAEVVSNVWTQHTEYWSPLSVDERIQIGVSAYVHGPFDGVAGGGSLAQPKLGLFDSRGALISFNTYAGTYDTGTFAYDAFTHPGSLTATRKTSLGNKYWSGASVGGTWQHLFNGSKGGYTFPPSTFSLQLLEATASSNISLAITFANVIEGQNVGIVFRASNSTNYFAVTNTGFYKVVAGSRSTINTWAAGTFVAGDRLRVRLGDGAFDLYRDRLDANGFIGTSTALRATYADTFNQTATLHGVIGWY